jgi:chemotaxis protein MotB
MEAAEAEMEKMKGSVEKLQTEVNEFDSKYNVAQRKINALESDTAVLGTSLRILRQQYDKINELNEQLLSKSSLIHAETEAERQNLMGELETVRIQLQTKEDALNELEQALQAKEEELVERERKLDELKAVISQKDSVMNALKKNVTDALLGFEGKGLEIEKRNGRIYVKMDAKLLFAKGSTEVSPEGSKAVIDLARAVQSEEGLRIMVEGHTDADEFNRSSFPRNNWDLSVLRSTSVINLMIENSDIDPEILTAAGRSKYQPVDPNDMAKNRRIEVVISPRLDELLEMIDE